MRRNIPTLVLAAAMAVPMAALSQPAVSVPFVGCPSDGQAGPSPAPAAGPIETTVTPETASRLSFYGSSDGAVVPGPREWHCVGFYGSSGYTLVLTPSAAPGDLEAITGPAIELNVFHGDTSGRFAVARAVARAFPAEEAFARRVAGEGLLPAGALPAGPHPSDRMVYRAARVVEFETGARSEGLGTAGRLTANDAPIRGVAILEGDTPDLITLAVRLPAELGALAGPIITEFLNSRESAAAPLQ